MIVAFSGFSGAGAVLLGQWEGWRHAGACDRDAFCRAVIAHHLPGVPLFDDMDAVPWETAWSDCSPEDGLASHSASPAFSAARPTSETDGDLSSPPFAVVDRISRSWKTSQQSFLTTADGTGADASPTWTRSGTMRNGWSWERTLPAPTTAGDVCGSSAGVGTWPTPCAADAASAASAANRTAGRSNPDSKHHSGTTLTDAIRLWPTPSASNPNDHEPIEKWEARRLLEIEKGQNGNGMGMPLSIAVRLCAASACPTSPTDPVTSSTAGGRAWPTPTRAAAKSQGKYGNGAPTLCSAVTSWATPNTHNDRGATEPITTRPSGSKAQIRLQDQARGLLNPRWVEALMGWPPGWTGLPAEAIAQLRQEKRRASGKRRAPAAASPAAPTRCEPSATAGTSRARSSRGGRSPGALASDSTEGTA